MLLVGILAFVSTFELDDKSSTVSMALMVLGNRFIPYGDFPSLLEIKRGCLFTNKSVAKRA